jgi:cytochrome subunit of sulfide dehydrogenase
MTPGFVRAAAVTLTMLLGLVTAPAQAAPPSQAQSWAATCATCHGGTGRAAGALKPIAGLPVEQHLQMLAGFADGSRPATVMHQIVRGYDADQLRQIAEFFATQREAR